MEVKDKVIEPLKKNIGGRPRKFPTPQHLSTAFNKYLNKTKEEEYTVSGLALVVGSKASLSDYSRRKGYIEVVAEAKLIVEESYEKALRKHGRSGDIFALKNFGWTDAQRLDHTFSQSLYTENDGKTKETIENESLQIAAAIMEKRKGIKVSQET